jgi:hypothetical protein
MQKYIKEGTDLCQFLKNMEEVIYKNDGVERTSEESIVAIERIYSLACETGTFESKTLDEHKNNEIADRFEKLQMYENDGRGVSCVKGIVSYLRRGDFRSAEIMAFNEDDKIHNYLLIHNLSIQTFPMVRELYT